MQLNRFAVYAWGVLIYNIAVILWGAFVRATGSGAGCGNHWPLCDGEVIPRAPEVATLIEFTHRLTSGIALLLVFAMLVWAFRAYAKGHPVRLGAILSTILIVIEALIGAGLVVLGLVADNDSIPRAVAMALHLMNTFLLLGALALTAWWASGGARIHLANQGAIAWALAVGFIGMLVVGASGAVTALGDTLFPAASLAEGWQEKFSPTAHILIRLRLYHPIIAIGVGLYLIAIAGWISYLRPDPTTRRFARALTLLYLLQIGIGAVNVILLAPVWMQIIHLLMSDLIWIALVLLAASVLSRPAEQASGIPVTHPTAQRPA